MVGMLIKINFTFKKFNFGDRSSGDQIIGLQSPLSFNAEQSIAE